VNDYLTQKEILDADDRSERQKARDGFKRWLKAASAQAERDDLFATVWAQTILGLRDEHGGSR